ncbi:MAG: hypothetical protein AMJ90_01620 [candidate division Zixibacteria bacterium SM23_73_2]|nr:MAG: hypothetical protein AMJ90_01620 [candidate division Zixibacteria bacterium SM23_73_2]
MKVQVNKEKDWKRTLEIEIEKEEVEKEYQQAFKEIKNKSKIPGFRPGKAPLAIIKSRYQDVATGDVMRNLVPRAYQDALKESNLIPVSDPVLKEIDLKPGSPLKFKAEIEILPQVEVKDYRGLAITKRKFEVKDEDLDKNIEFLKEQNATLNPVERKAKEGDFILVDLEKLPGNGVKGEKAADQQVLLGKNLLPEFFDAFLNSRAGEQKDFEVSYPDNYRDKELANKKVKYRVQIKEVKEKVYPEMDDSFAKTCGFSDLLDMRLKIRKDLERKAEEESVRDLQDQLIKKVIEKNDFEVPESYVKNSLDSVVEDFKKNYEKIDEEKIKEQYQDLIKNGFKWKLLLHQIAEKERMEVSSEDVKDWTQNFAKNNNLTLEKAREFLAKQKKLEDLKETILEKKVLNLLERNAIIVEDQKIDTKEK